jgi:hypothetical protein
MAAIQPVNAPGLPIGELLSLTGLQGSGVDLINSLPGIGRATGPNDGAFFSRMINMAFGILLNTSIEFGRLDRCRALLFHVFQSRIAVCKGVP